MNFFFIAVASFFCLQAKEFKNLIHGSWWAHYQSCLKNTGQASDWFAQVISVDNSVCTNKGYIHYLYKHGLYHDLIDCFQAKKNLIGQDDTIKKLYALALFFEGRISESDALFVELAKSNNHDLEICFYAAQALMRTHQYLQALALIDRYLLDDNKEAGTFILYFLKSQICLQLNNVYDAKIACQKAVLMRPDFEKGWLLLAVLAEQEGDFSTAISGYKQYLALDVQSAIDTDVYNGILAAIARNFFLNQGNQTKQNNGSISLQKAHAAFKSKQYLETIEYANQFLCDNPSHLDVLCLKIESLVELERYQDVIDCVLDQVQQSPNNKSWYKIIDWCIKYGSVDSELIMNRLKKVQDADTKTTLPALYMIDYYRNNNMYEKAEELFTILNNQLDDPHLKKNLLFCSAEMYNQQQQYEKMVIQLTKILEINSDDSRAFELLADHFINQKEYEKALEMVNQWRVLHALCPRALTKHGFILYKQGNYDGAQELFSQAQIYQNLPLLLFYKAKIARKKGLHDTAYQLCLQAKNNATESELVKINALIEKILTEKPRQSVA